MMIQTEGGQNLEVPDGYSPADIDQVLNHVQPPQMQGVMREPALAGSNLASGILNALSIPSQVSSLVRNAENKYVIDPVFGTHSPPSQPVAATLLDAAGQTAGITNRPDLQPQGAGERYLAAGARGVGSALPFAAGGGLPLLAAQGAGSGMGAQAAEDSGAGPWGQFFASMAGGGLAGGLESVGARAINRMAGNLSPIAQAYKTVGMTPQLAGNATDSWGLKWMQNIASGFPGAAGKMQEVSGSELENFGKSVDNFASKFGQSETLQDAGTALQQQGKTWLDRFKGNSSKAWGAVDAEIGNTPANLSNTEQAISAIKNQAPQNPALQKFLGSKLANDIDGILGEAKGSYKPASIDPNSGLIIPSSGKAAAPLTWRTLQKLRSRVGEYLENPDLIADAGTAQAKQLYGALSQDMKNTALVSGKPKALPLFNMANDFTRTGHDFIENALSGIVGKGIKPEDAANFALNSSKLGGTTLASLREQIPEGVDELAAAKLRSASKSLQQNAAGTAVSPARFLSELGGVGNGGKMSPEAMDALIPEVEDQNKMQAFKTVAGSIKKTESLANTSKTASHAVPGLMLAGAVEGAKKGYELGGATGAVGLGALGGAAPLAMGYPFAKITTNPALINLMSGAAQKAPEGIPTKAALAALAYANQRR